MKVFNNAFKKLVTFLFFLGTSIIFAQIGPEPPPPDFQDGPEPPPSLIVNQGILFLVLLGIIYSFIKFNETPKRK